MERVEGDEIKGEEVKMCFSGKYMVDGLKVLEGREIDVRFSGGMRGLVLGRGNDD